MKKLSVKILRRFGQPSADDKNTIILTWDNWNDYSYYTLFGMAFVDDASKKHEIGAIKIGYFGQEEGYHARKFDVDDEFDKGLDEEYFSLGQSDEYYSNLNKLGDDTRDLILYTLNDIAKNEELYERAVKESVTKVSLFRTVSPSTVKGQYRKLASGGVRLTEYNFRFIAPKIKQNSSNFDLIFEITPESLPPTNIHVLIGRNGVGKTFLINNMINALLENKQDKYGIFKFFHSVCEDWDKGNEFANLISVSFSAFDDMYPHPEIKDKTEGLQYSYVGLKQIKENNVIGTKSTTKLKNEFFRSFDYCRSSKKVRWKTGIEILESDPYFKESNIKSLIDIEDDDEFKKQTFDIFKRLSSGHKIVLLTITRIIETLQEKSLVLIDEPEAHLHPPLLSAFIRALSELLILTNGVAIIVTHSPVILQEVPKSCVWKLRRYGAESIAEKLEIESFGENVGILTQEIFGLEVTNSGFHKMLQSLTQEHSTYEHAIRKLGGQLGLEGKAILRNLFLDKLCEE